MVASSGPVSKVDLSQYQLVGRYDLPEPTRTQAPANNLLGQEASAVTYNWDNDSLFVLGDGGTAIVQVSKLDGSLIDTMTLAQGNSPQNTEFYDPEGLTYIGGGQFVMVEERYRQAVLFTYAANTTLARSDAKTVKLGTTIGNIGLEGISYDPATGGYVLVKEITPEGLFQTSIDFDAGTASNGSANTLDSTNLFDPASAGLSDFADIYALSNLPSLLGTNYYNTLLVLSQEQSKIVAIGRNGSISSSLQLQGAPGVTLPLPNQQTEGLTMDRDGILYVVTENGGGDINHPQLWIYAPTSGVNQPPSALTLTNQISSLLENTSTATRFKVADLQINDDGNGTNTLGLAGTDAAFFEVDNSGLYIKASTTLDFESKASYAVTVIVDDSAVGATPDASANFDLRLIDQVIENPTTVDLIISEVAPWSSGNSPLTADWFEITNRGSSTIDISGWKFDDNSESFDAAVALSGISSIAAGESVIFIETGASQTAAGNAASFLSTWFGTSPPTGLRLGSYTGSGVGLSSGGDKVNLFNATGLLQASVSFGASPGGPDFPTFNNAAGLNNSTITTLSAIGTDGAAAAVNDTKEIGSPGTVGTTGKLFISEVAPWSSSNSPVGADWFELTNSTSVAINISGWKIDDSSGSPVGAVALNGITTIGGGESVIFIETGLGQTAAANAEAFINTWFAGTAPTGLQIGSYSGSGVGLSTSADAVNIYDTLGALKANVDFRASSTGPFASFDNASALNNTTLTQLSIAGTNGAFIAATDPNEIGSPGAIVNQPGPNAPPTALAFTNSVSSLPESSSTASPIKVADITITDDGRGSNAITLSGVDAASFEVSGTGLFLKAGTALDFEVKTAYAVTVSASDLSIPSSTPVTAAFALAVSDVNELPPGTTPVQGAFNFNISADRSSTFLLDVDSTNLNGKLFEPTLLPRTGEFNLTLTKGGFSADLPVQSSSKDVIQLEFITDGSKQEVVLSEQVSNDRVEIETIAGSARGILPEVVNNYIHTRGGDDKIIGSAGVDYIRAGAGDDIIDGGAGNDVVRSGIGNDRITLGAGADKLLITRDQLQGRDKLLDFSAQDALVLADGISVLGGLGSSILTVGFSGGAFQELQLAGTSLPSWNPAMITTV